MGKGGEKWFAPWRKTLSEFEGRHLCKVDSKGRVNVPQNLRETFAKHERFFITNNQFQKKALLDLVPESQWLQLKARLAKLSPFKREVQVFQRFYVSGGQSINCDGQGRLLIPGPLRKFANIDDEIYLVGMGTKLEIWSKKSWDKLYGQLADDFDDIQSQLAELEVSA